MYPYMVKLDINISSQQVSPQGDSSQGDAVHTWLVFLKASQALYRRMSTSLEECGLGDSDFRVLEVLLHKGGMAVNAIGPRVNLTPGSISVAIERLYARGLVSRVESATDRRSRIVDLTDAGRALITPAFARHAALIEQTFAVLSPDERAQLEALLKKLGRFAESDGDFANP